jgi:hypothetical protein
MAAESESQPWLQEADPKEVSLSHGAISYHVVPGKWEDSLPSDVAALLAPPVSVIAHRIGDVDVAPGPASADVSPAQPLPVITAIGTTALL